MTRTTYTPMTLEAAKDVFKAAGHLAGRVKDENRLTVSDYAHRAAHEQGLDEETAATAAFLIEQLANLLARAGR